LYKPPYYPEISKRYNRTCILFSEELKFLSKVGYKFIVKRFLKFKAIKGIFITLVNHFYTIKKNADKSILRGFSKILLNSLYGRFSMKIAKENSIFISAAISSYARIEIFQYKVLKDYLYSDTDSIFYYSSIKDIYIGKSIGLLKLESEISEIDIIREKMYIYTGSGKKVIKASGLGKYIGDENQVRNKLIVNFLRDKNLQI